jgi:hypothetical protein
MKENRMKSLNEQLAPLRIFIAGAAFLSFSPTSSALYLDGDGHYAMRGETRTAPAMSGRSRTFQAIDQSFRLNGELRFNDDSSFFLEFKLFDDPRQSYLGDVVQPEECSARRGSSNENCEGRHQDVSHPGYKPYSPQVTKAYAKYAFEYCLLEAGRRGRDWGLGIFLDSGKKPFDTSMSVYDGITCDVNIQKSQELGFSFGYDKLSETGAYPYSPFDNPNLPRGENDNCAENSASGNCKDPDYGTTVKGTGLGPQYRQDDHDQFFFTINYDDHHGDSGSRLTKQIGIYFADVVSASDGAGSGTDLKLFDLYLAFFLRDLRARVEIFGRQGRSGDPSFARLGGAQSFNETVKNNVQTFALAGDFEWTLATSGSAVGPAEFKEGNANRHLLFLDYAVAPGAGQGYYSQTDTEGNELEDSSNINVARRAERKTQAVAFNRNYKPALILFNERVQSNYLRVDGAFDPGAVMNTTLFGAGYRYEDLDRGNFEVKLITGQLSESMPTAVKEYYRANLGKPRPVGFFGKELGYELDLKYWKSLTKQLDLGLAGGYVLPGTAWQIYEGESPKNNLLVQSYITLNF